MTASTRIILRQTSTSTARRSKRSSHFDRNGFAYVLDRTDGTLLRANKYVTVNWAEKVDMKTGRPVKVTEHSPLCRRPNTQACPSAMGGKDQQPCVVDPKEPANVLLPTNNWCMELNPQERSHTQQGTVYVFANVYMYPEKPGITGKFKKFNVVTGKTEWEVPDPVSELGRHADTAGGLVFYGSLGGDFRAVDRNSGKVLWSRKLGSGIIGNPIQWQGQGQDSTSRSGRHRRLDRPAGHRGSRSQRQVRCDRRHRDDQGRRPQPHPAGRHAVHVPRGRCDRRVRPWPRAVRRAINRLMSLLLLLSV